MVYERAVNSYRKTSVETSDPINLIILCYEESLQAIRRVMKCYEERDFETKARYLTKAEKIIGELLCSLDRDKGGVIAANLANLYTYMLNRLTRGDLAQDMRAFGEVAGMLAELLEAWRDVSADTRTRTELSHNHKPPTLQVSGIAV